MMRRTGLAATLLFAAAPLAADAGLQVQATAVDVTHHAAQPSITADQARGRFILSWQERDGEGCTVLRTATLSTEGVLGEPREAARGCDWFVNWADFPSLAVADNGDWWTFYLRKNAASTSTYDILLLRSQDDGRTWSAPVVPHDDGTPTEHGFVSMVAQGADRMLVVWLDGRRTVDTAQDHGAGHDNDHGHAHGEGPMTLRSVEIGRDGTLRRPHEIDARVCSCCPTDLVRTEDGAVVVYRDRSEAEVRDVYSARYREGRWSPGTPVRRDGWTIAACPVNGPAAAVRAGEVLAAWPTMDGAVLSVKAAVVGADAPAAVLESGHAVLGRPDLAPAGDGHWWATWLGAGSERSTVLRAVLLDGALRQRHGRVLTRLPPGRGMGMPRIASLDNVAAVAWTEPKGGEGSEAHVGSVHVALLRPVRRR